MKIKVGMKCIGLDDGGNRHEGRILAVNKHDTVLVLTTKKEFVTLVELHATWRRVIAVDFDGTISLGHFPGAGPVNEKIKEAIIHEKNNGAIIVLWTCREDYPDEGLYYLTDAVNFCKENGIPIDYVNEQPNFKTRKVVADEYWDDKAINVKEFE